MKQLYNNALFWKMLFVFVVFFTAFAAIGLCIASLVGMVPWYVGVPAIAYAAAVIITACANGEELEKNIDRYFDPRIR